MKLKLITILLLSIFLTGCDNTTADPAPIVETYLQAKAEGDADTIRNLLCAEKEASFDVESLSFADLDARTDGLSCTTDGDNRVACDGKIIVTYGTEDTEFPFGAYSVVQEDGEWKYCGETQ